MQNNNIPIKNIDPIPEKIYVRQQFGRYQKIRKQMGSIFMFIFALIPWLTWNQNPIFRINIPQGQVHLFSLNLWPQEFLMILMFIFMIAAFALFAITAIYGRVWCGYMCPQTIWTFIFIWCEETFEGTANQRKSLDKSKLSFRKLKKKSLKHLAWILISLVTAITFVGYFTPIRDLIIAIFTLSSSFWLTFFTLLFTLITYLNAGFMRTRMCNHICPYARFQSAMFSVKTLIVTYNEKRGEIRGPRKRQIDHKAQGLGDCVDCKLCVQVCPAGIDIRNGLQYECIHCGACIDACEQVMERMNYPSQLISYISLNTEKSKQSKLNTSLRSFAYLSVIMILLGIMFVQLSKISNIEMQSVASRTQDYRETSQGAIENSYLLTITNKYNHPVQAKISVQTSHEKNFTIVVGQSLLIPASSHDNYPVTLSIPKAKAFIGYLPIRFVLESNYDNKQTTENFFYYDPQN